MFDKLLPKYSKNINVVETNNFKTCVITNNNGFKCWGWSFKPHLRSDFRENIKKIYTKGAYICAIRFDNLLNCWLATDRFKQPMPNQLNTDSVSIQYNPNRREIKI